MNFENLKDVTEIKKKIKELKAKNKLKEVKILEEKLKKLRMDDIF